MGPFSVKMRSHALFVIILGFFVIVGGTKKNTKFDNSTANSSKKPFEVCYTTQCQRSALQLKSTMNKLVDPCENFYEFACGNFGKNDTGVTPEEFKQLYANLTPDDWFEVIQFNLNKKKVEYFTAPISDSDVKPVEQVKKLHKQCMDLNSKKTIDKKAELKSFETIKKMLVDVGLPVLPPLANASLSNFSLIHTMAAIKLKFHKDIFIRFISSEYYKPMHRLLPRFTVPENNVHSLLYKLNDLREQEHQCDKNETANITSKFDCLYYQKKDKLTHYVLEIVKYVYNISDVKMTKHDQRKVEEKVTKFRYLINEYKFKFWSHGFYWSSRKIASVNINGFPKAANSSKIDLKQYMRELMRDVNVTLDFNDEQKEKYILAAESDGEYLAELYKWLEKQSVEDLAFFMWLESIHALSLYSTTNLQVKTTEYINKVTNDKYKVQMDSQCILSIEEIFETVSTLIPLMQTKKSQISFHDVDNMVINIQEAFHSNIKAAKWLEYYSKLKIINKLNRMQRSIGFVPVEAELIQDYYSDFSEVDVDKNDFLVNIIKLKQIQVLEAGMKLYSRNTICVTDDDDDDELPFDKFMVNAFYEPLKNKITIPAGIMQFPFYGHQIQALNYGSLGLVVGHELTHGFDNNGRKYNEFGFQNKSKWSNETVKEYEKHVECFIESYNKLDNNKTSNDTKKESSGSRTINENIADNGGLSNAFDAYKYFIKNQKEGVPEPRLVGLENYSPEQLFFWSFANTWCETPTYKSKYSFDVHSANRLRVLGSFSNSKEFADAWKCPAGSKMNPVEKCKIW